MRFILNETTLVDKRFILTEALPLADLATYCDDICKHIKKIQASLDNIAKDDTVSSAIEQIFRQTDSLMQNTRNVKDISVLRGYLKEYLNITSNLLNELGLDTSKSQDKDVKNLFANLEAYAKDTDTSGRARKDLLNELNRINSVIEAFRKSLRSSKNIAGESESKSVLLIRAYEDFYKINKLTDHEYRSNEIISKAVANMHKAIADKDDVFISKLKELYDSGFKDTVNSLSVKNFDRDDFEKARDKDNVDLVAKYKTMGDTDEFWQLCFTQIFGKDSSGAVDKSKVTKVINLGDSVKQQFKVLGFEEASNLFITFIKNYLLDSSHNFPIDKQHYELIHNTIAKSENALKLIDLVKPASPLTEDNNIIFFKDFYLKPVDACKEYLTYQGIWRNQTYENISQFNTKDLPDESAKLVDDLKTETTMASIIKKVMFEGPDKLQQLSKIKTISDIFDLNTKKASNAPWNNKNTPLLVNMIETDSTLTSKPEWAKKFIRCIADSQPLNDVSLSELTKLDNEYSWFSSTVVDFNDKTKIINMLKNYGGIIDWPALHKIIEVFEKQKDSSGKGWLE